MADTLPTAPELLEQVDKLPHSRRIETACRLGNQFRDDAQLTGLIDDLREHPDPALPEVELDEGFSEVLPPQKRNVSKFYGSDALALAAASASKKHKDVLIDELKSESRFFKKLVVKEVVRQEKSDDDVIELVKQAPRAVQNKIIHACIRHGRFEVLDRLFDDLVKWHGIPFACTIVHALNDERLLRILQENEEIRHHKNVKWCKICRYHPKVIIALMRHDFVNCPTDDDSSAVLFGHREVWGRWEDFLTTGTWKKALDELLYNAQMSTDVLKLDAEFPIYMFEGSNARNPEWRRARNGYVGMEEIIARPYLFSRQLPPLINKRLKHFLMRNPDEMYEWFCSSITLNFEDRLRTSIPMQFFAYRRLPFDHLIKVIRKVLESASPNSIFSQQRFHLRTEAEKEIPMSGFMLKVVAGSGYREESHDGDVHEFFRRFGRVVHVQRKPEMYVILEGDGKENVCERAMEEMKLDGDQRIVQLGSKEEGYFDAVATPIWGFNQVSRSSYASDHYSQNMSAEQILLGSHFMTSLQQWSPKQAEVLINLVFELLHRIRPDTPEGDRNLATWHEISQTFFVNCMSTLTMLKNPATAKENRYFDCITLLVERYAALIETGRAGYVDRIQKHAKLEIQIKEYHKSQTDRRKKEPHKMDSSRKDPNVAILDRIITHIQHSNLIQGVTADTIDRIQESWTNFQNVDCVLTDAAIGRVHTIRGAVVARREQEQAALHEFHRCWTIIIQQMRTDHIHRYSREQKQTLITKYLHMLQVVRGTTCDWDLAEWKRNFSMFLSQFHITYDLTRPGDAKKHEYYVQSLFGTYTDALRTMWTTEWRRKFPERLQFFNQMHSSVSSWLEDEMKSGDFSLYAYPAQAHLDYQVNSQSKQEKRLEKSIKNFMHGSINSTVSKLNDIWVRPEDTPAGLATRCLALKHSRAKVSGVLTERTIWAVKDLQGSITRRIKKATDEVFADDKRTADSIVTFSHSSFARILGPEQLRVILNMFMEAVEKLKLADIFDFKSYKTYRDSIWGFLTHWMIPEAYALQRKPLEANDELQRQFVPSDFEDCYSFAKETLTTLLKNHWRRGLDAKLKIVSQVRGDVQESYEEQKRYYTVRQKEKDDDIELQDDVDIKLTTHLRKLSRDVSNVKIREIEAIWANFKSFSNAQLRGTEMGEALRPKLGTVYNDTNYLHLEMVLSNLSGSEDQIVRDIQQVDVGVIRQLVDLVKENKDIKFVMGIFRELVPVFAASQPELSEDTVGIEWDQVYKGLCHVYLKRLSREEQKALLREKVAEAEEKESGDVEMYDIEKTFSSDELSSYISEIFMHFFDYYAKYPVENADFLIPLLKYATDDQFKPCYEKLGDHPLEHVAMLVALMKKKKGDPWTQIFESFAKIPEPVRHIPYIIEVIPHATPQQHMIIFKSFSTENLNYLAETDPYSVIKMMEYLHAESSTVLIELRQVISQWLVQLLADPSDAKKGARKLLGLVPEEAETLGNITADTRDKLLKYLDINNNKIREVLIAFCDSKFEAERFAAMDTLVNATLLCGPDTRLLQGRKTLSFFAQKIRNESVDNRLWGLNLLLQHGSVSLGAFLHEEMLSEWDKLLKDALEDNDLDKDIEKDSDILTYDSAENHRILTHFVKLSKAALSLGAGDTSGAMFQWGIEVQWKICFFRCGERGASEKFRIKVNNDLLNRGYNLQAKNDKSVLFTEDKEQQFVTDWLEAYKTRVLDRNPKYLDTTESSVTYFNDLVSIVGRNSSSIPELRAFLETMLERVKKEAEFIFSEDKKDEKDEKDDDIILIGSSGEPDDDEEDDEDCDVKTAISTLMAVLSYNMDKYKEIEIFNSYITTLFEVVKHEAPKRGVNAVKWNTYTEICAQTLTVFSDISKQFAYGQDVDSTAEWWSDEFLANFAVNFLIIVGKTEDRDDKQEFTKLEQGTFLIFDELMRDNFGIRKNWWDIPILQKYVSMMAHIIRTSKPRSGLLSTAVERQCGTWLVNLVGNKKPEVPILGLAETMQPEGTKWHEIECLTKFVDAFVDNLEKCEDTDSDGLLVLEKDYYAIETLEKVFKVVRKLKHNWLDIPCLTRYNHVLLRSRQASVVLWRWVGGRTENPKNRKHRQQLRNEIIEELLGISKSAIHIRLVWRHLVTFRQDLLDEFINSGEPYRGVFFIPHEDRLKKPGKVEKKEEKAEPVPRSGLGIRGRPRPRGRKKMVRSSLSRRVPQPYGTGNIADVSGFLEHVDNVATEAHEAVAEERKARKKFEEEKEIWEASHARKVQKQKEAEAADGKQDLDVGGDSDDDDEPSKEMLALVDARWDHQDMFCIPGCYGLWRLLPRQINALAQQRVAEVLNGDRGRPEQVKAAIRWTLLPTTSYADVVMFLERHKKEFSVNIEEALLRGCMENDEVLAPLHYLLDPKFLSSDRARVAAYVISKCISHMKHGVFTRLLKEVLKGKRRHALKVTAYKEVIRLLMKFPTRVHIRMIVREWKRDQLHRDVRIEILKAAFQFLVKSREIAGAEQAAWDIFETAVTHEKIRTNVEILSTLVGAKCELRPNDTDPVLITIPDETQLPGMVMQPRLIEQLNEFAEVEIPLRHCERYAKTVILALCDRVNTIQPATLESKREEKRKREEKDKQDKDEKDDDIVMVDDGKVSKKDESSKDEKTNEMDTSTDVEPPKIRSADDLAYLAIAYLPRWLSHGIKNEACKIFYDVLIDDCDDFVVNTKSTDQQTNENRWKFALKSLFALVDYSLASEGLKHLIPDALKSFWSSIKGLDLKQRDKRKALYGRLSQVISTKQRSITYHVAVYEILLFIETLRGFEGEFDNIAFDVESTMLYRFCESYHEYQEKACNYIHRLVGYVIEHDDLTSARGWCRTVLQRPYGWKIHDRETRHPVEVYTAMVLECLNEQARPATYLAVVRNLSEEVLSVTDAFKELCNKDAGNAWKFVEMLIRLKAHESTKLSQVTSAIRSLTNSFIIRRPEHIEETFKRTLELSDEKPLTAEAIVYMSLSANILRSDPQRLVDSGATRSQVVDLVRWMIRLHLKEIQPVPHLWPLPPVFARNEIISTVEQLCRYISPHFGSEPVSPVFEAILNIFIDEALANCQKTEKTEREQLMYDCAFDLIGNYAEHYALVFATLNREKAAQIFDMVLLKDLKPPDHPKYDEKTTKDTIARNIKDAERLVNRLKVWQEPYWKTKRALDPAKHYSASVLLYAFEKARDEEQQRPATELSIYQRFSYFYTKHHPTAIELINPTLLIDTLTSFVSYKLRLGSERISEKVSDERITSKVAKQELRQLKQEISDILIEIIVKLSTFWDNDWSIPAHKKKKDALSPLRGAVNLVIERVVSRGLGESDMKDVGDEEQDDDAAGVYEIMTVRLLLGYPVLVWSAVAPKVPQIFQKCVEDTYEIQKDSRHTSINVVKGVIDNLTSHLCSNWYRTRHLHNLITWFIQHICQKSTSDSDEVSVVYKALAMHYLSTNTHIICIGNPEKLLQLATLVLEHKPASQAPRQALPGILLKIAEFWRPEFKRKREMDGMTSSLVLDLVSKALAQSDEMKDSDESSEDEKAVAQLIHDLLKSNLELLCIAAPDKISALFKFFLRRSNNPSKCRKLLRGISRFFTPHWDVNNRLHSITVGIINDVIKTGVRVGFDPSFHFDASSVSSLESASVNLLDMLIQNDIDLLSIYSLDGRALPDAMFSVIHLLCARAAQGDYKPTLNTSITKILDALKKKTAVALTEEEKEIPSPPLEKISETGAQYIRALLLNEVPMSAEIELGGPDIRSAAHHREMLKVGLFVCQCYPNFILAYPDVVKQFFYNVVSYCAELPLEESQTLISTIKSVSNSNASKGILRRLFEWVKTAEDYELTKKDFLRKKQIEAAKKQGMDIDHLKEEKRDDDEVSEERVNAIKTWLEMFANLHTFKQGDESNRFKYLAGSIALDVLIYYGERTQLKTKSAAEGGSITDLIVWRPQLEELLNHFCVHPSARLRHQALCTLTEK